MIKKVIFFPLVVVLFFLVSCDLARTVSVGDGTMIIYARDAVYQSPGAQRFLPEDTSGISRFAISGKSGRGASFSRESGTSDAVRISGLEPGIWNVEISGLNGSPGDPVELLKSEVEVRILPGETSVVPEDISEGHASLEILPGDGQVVFSAELPASVEGGSVTLSLRSGSTFADDLSIQASSASGESAVVAQDTFTLPAGLYSFSLQISGGNENWTPRGEILVLRGATTRVRLYFSRNSLSEAIVADHRAVEEFESIPSEWIDAARQLLLSFPGESHSRAFLYGMELLEQENSDRNLSVEPVWDTAPPEYPHGLMISRAYWEESDGEWEDDAGEEDIWTHSAAVNQTIDHVSHFADILGSPLDLFGWMWCWDMADGPSVSDGWAGEIFTTFDKYGDEARSVTPWDIDSTEVSLQDYFTAMERISAENPRTVVFLVTGVVDGGSGHGERGYQRWLKNEAIREYARTHNKVLFDYADILTHTGTGQEVLEELESGERFPVMYEGYEGNFGYEPHGGSHVSRDASVRLAKALWWMLARVAGWEGTPD